ncbi:MAG TPA: hypothetical protein VJR29_00880 [bacterium]|nr:hypothetical protein [bacterium]
MTPPAILQRLERLSPPEAQLLRDWFQENPVGLNLGLQLLDLLEDLAKKERRPLADFFSLIPGDERIQPKERARQWRDRLEQRLHPHRTAHRAAFAERIRGLDLPEGVEIDPPQGFEGPNYTLRVRFADKEELRRRLLELGQSLEKRDWAWLWEF